MARVGWLTTRFLDLSETFIYEPLQLMDKHQISVYAWQRRNLKNFPYADTYTWDDLKEKDRKSNTFWNNFGQERYLLGKMRQNGIRLLHAHYGYMGINALQYQEKLQIPLVTSFYGLDVYQHTKNLFYLLQLQHLFKRGQLFLVCSQKMRNDLIELGAKPSTIRVIYGGAKLNKFPFKLNIPKNDDQNIDMLMCGRFVEKKGFEYGIKAFLAVAHQYENLRLKIIGSGREEQKLKGIVAKSPFGNQVQFLGNKSHSEYIDEIKKCHIFMAPSVIAKNGDSEGLPTVLIEAAALGRPLIATKHSGIPEIVNENNNGFLVEEKNVDELALAIKRMVNSTYKWEDYANYGRRLVETDFNLEKQAQKIENLYSELLKP